MYANKPRTVQRIQKLNLELLTTCTKYQIYGAILEPESKMFRTTTLEFHDFSGIFQDLCLFKGLSTVENLNI